MYGLAVMQTISNSTLIKNIDKISKEKKVPVKSNGFSENDIFGQDVSKCRIS